MVLHIGNDRAVPKRDIVAVLNADALTGRPGINADIDMGACPDKAALRSVLVCVRGKSEKLYGSPISACALFARSAQF